MRLKNDNVNPDGTLRLKTDFSEPVKEEVKEEKPKKKRKKKGE